MKNVLPYLALFLSALASHRRNVTPRWLTNTELVVTGVALVSTIAVEVLDWRDNKQTRNEY